MAYRRHLKGCAFTSALERKCRCPIWVDGVLDGKRCRRSLKTRSWERGQIVLRKMEVSPELPPITTKEACEQFMDWNRGRNLREASLYKYDLLARELTAEFPGLLKSVSVPDLQRYQSSWKLCPESRLYKLSRLRKFFRWCVDNGWLRENPARNLAQPILQRKPVVPFSEEEMEKILWATEVYPDNPKGRQKQVRAFVLVLRYTGLRIGDAVALRKECVQNGKLLLRTAKTGTMVWIPLKQEVWESLNDLPTNGGYYFWSGNGTLKAAVSSWHRSMSTLFRLAGVEGHPHQFRHFFSVDLLSRGVSIENVAALLGHANTNITQKHYAAWIKSRQVALEMEIEKAWKSA